MEIKTVLGNRVLVKQIVEEKTEVEKEGVIVSADSINPSYFVGEVVAVGESVDESLCVGHKVVFLKYGYQDMGDNQFIVEYPSVLAILG